MKKFKLIVMMLCLFIPLSFAGCENKNKQTLSTPHILEVKGGTIVFDPVADAEYYTLSINDLTLNLDVKHNSNISIIDDKINFDATNIFVVGDSYSIKIMAKASNKENSKYSSTYSYKHNGNVAKPGNLKINGTILTWDAVENASYYVVKVITPNDQIVFDKQGNILTEDDSETISRADLTEYTFNTNQFNFGSLLSTAGNYKFYVCAVLSAGGNWVESGYSSSESYKYFVKLNTPTNGLIKKVGNDIHLTTTIDTNANAISISCNNITKTEELDNLLSSCAFINDNYIDINLTNYFYGQEIDFTNLSQYAFRIQAKHIAVNPENAFYYDSEMSDFVYFEQTQKLATPIVNLVKDNVNDCYQAQWACSDQTQVSKYKLYLFLADEVKEYSLDSNITNKLIYEDFVAVAVKAIGVGNFEESALSVITSNPEHTSTSSQLTITNSDTTLTWSNIGANYYVIELGNEITVVETNSFAINTNKLADKNYEVKITPIKVGHITTTKKVDLYYSSQLETPTIGYGQGFASTNLYEFSFTGVDNAAGYYIYLKTKDSDSFERIDTLYQSTTIDLSKYICNEGSYNDYLVCVQAVADRYGLFTDSELSRAIEVSHVKVLDVPEFQNINGTTTPVTKQNLGNSSKYTLRFYGVSDAECYEILINYNKISLTAKNNFYTGLYEVDISKYLIAANNYEIKIRAIPSETAVNVQSSAYNTANYILTKQLSTVQSVKVTENNGIYSLTFDPVDNAESYRVRIVKEGDSNYVNYLNSIGLSTSIVVNQSLDVTDYVKQKGIYYFYVTALAPKVNSYYADATESSSYGYVSKLTTLEQPTDVSFANLSKQSYLLGWTGDEHADYYLVKITNPNNISYEFKVFAETSTNINKYMTVEGTYKISISSMVTATSQNAKEYTSSSAYDVSMRYNYETLKDFERYSVYMYGAYYNFAVNNVNDLKHLLWYHYLYEIDQTSQLTLMINLQDKEDLSKETVREAIARMAQEANDSMIYNFSNDAEWLSLISEPATSDTVLFNYLSTKLIEAYPEFNILENLDIYHVATSQIFQLNYRNALNVEKSDPTTTTFTNKSYANEFKYIDLYSRKSPTGLFAIDTKESEFVTTTEQLLHAVQHGKKPNFVGDSALAEQVYGNAKLVLSAIITNNMTDLEKATAIFDWLQSSFDLTYYRINQKAYISGAIESTNVSEYGLSKLYYLEGIFENITSDRDGNLIISSNLATSYSYSKAFALLCSIEGIETTIAHGTYTYYDQTTEQDQQTDHVWNKIKLSVGTDPFNKKWFNVDSTFSDNRVYFNDFTKGYGISSHSYFLVTDTMMETNLSVQSNLNLISSEYSLERAAKTQFDFYSNTSFKMTYSQIENTMLDFESETVIVNDFEYSRKYEPSVNYQKYAKTSGYGTLQSFLLNTIIYAQNSMISSGSNRSVFEFKFSWSDNGGSNIFDVVKLKEIFDTVPNQYSLRLKLVTDPNNNIYVVHDTENQTTTVIYIVEKTA